MLLTFEQFDAEVKKAASEDNRPSNWRYGQTVFNYIEQVFGVSRLVQFEKGVDCFYNDAAVDRFIVEAYGYYVKYNKEDGD